MTLLPPARNVDGPWHWCDQIPAPIIFLPMRKSTAETGGSRESASQPASDSKTSSPTIFANTYPHDESPLDRPPANLLAAMANPSDALDGPGMRPAATPMRKLLLHPLPHG